MRTIDADALLNGGIRVQCGLNDNGLIMIPMGDVRKSIENAPTVDAVPVVRCKDCRYRSCLMGRPPFMFYTCTCAEGLSGAVHDNSFCSYGERKDGDG